MIPLNKELIDALAAEYVLGTQSARVRRRMQRLLTVEPELASRVSYWEANLNQLSEKARPVPVPPWVWRRIEASLQPQEDETGSWWQNLALWRFAATAAIATAVILAVLPPPEPTTIMAAPEGGFALVLTDEESKTAWLVSRQTIDSPIKAEAIKVPVMTVQQAYELWLIPPDNSPLSLGLLNEQGNTLLQPAAFLNELVKPGYVMAVSIEPPGGSPTGAPTGPVVYTGSVTSL